MSFYEFSWGKNESLTSEGKVYLIFFCVFPKKSIIFFLKTLIYPNSVNSTLKKNFCSAQKFKLKFSKSGGGMIFEKIYTPDLKPIIIILTYYWYRQDQSPIKGLLMMIAILSFKTLTLG